MVAKVHRTGDSRRVGGGLSDHRRRDSRHAEGVPSLMRLVTVDLQHPVVDAAGRQRKPIAEVEDHDVVRAKLFSHRDGYRELQLVDSGNLTDAKRLWSGRARQFDQLAV